MNALLLQARSGNWHRKTQHSTCRRDNGLTENAGHEKDGPSKLQDMKLQDKLECFNCLLPLQ